MAFRVTVERVVQVVTPGPKDLWGGAQPVYANLYQETFGGDFEDVRMALLDALALSKVKRRRRRAAKLQEPS